MSRIDHGPLYLTHNQHVTNTLPKILGQFKKKLKHINFHFSYGQNYKTKILNQISFINMSLNPPLNNKYTYEYKKS